jgi:hypothetical protein
VYKQVAVAHHVQQENTTPIKGFHNAHGAQREHTPTNQGGANCASNALLENTTACRPGPVAHHVNLGFTARPMAQPHAHHASQEHLLLDTVLVFVTSVHWERSPQVTHPKQAVSTVLWAHTAQALAHRLVVCVLHVNLALIAAKPTSPHAPPSAQQAHIAHYLDWFMLNIVLHVNREPSVPCWDPIKCAQNVIQGHLAPSLAPTLQTFVINVSLDSMAL